MRDSLLLFVTPIVLALALWRAEAKGAMRMSATRATCTSE